MSAGPSSRDTGSISIEMAGAVILLASALALMLSLLGAVHRHLTLTAFARDAARAASLQGDRMSAERAAREVLHGAGEVRVRMHSEGGLVTVRLEQRVPLFRVAPITVSAEATALEEQPW